MGYMIALLVLTNALHFYFYRKLKHNLQKLIKDQKVEIMNDEKRIKRQYKELKYAEREIEKQQETIRRYDQMLGNAMPLAQNTGRKTGKTTRLTAYYIDLLFRGAMANTPWVKLDLPDIGAPNNHSLVNAIRRRLKYEHDNMRMSVKKQDGATYLSLKSIKETETTKKVKNAIRKSSAQKSI